MKCQAYTWTRPGWKYQDFPEVMYIDKDTWMVVFDNGWVTPVATRYGWDGKQIPKDDEDTDTWAVAFKMPYATTVYETHVLEPLTRKITRH